MSPLIDDEFGPWLSFRKICYVYLPNNSKIKDFLFWKKNVEYIIFYTIHPKSKLFLQNLTRDKCWQVIFFKNNLLVLKKSGDLPQFDEKFFAENIKFK